MLLEELVSLIGSSATDKSTDASRKFPWVFDERIPSPKNADQVLAMSISSGEIQASTSVAEFICSHKLEQSALASIRSPFLSESSAVRLLVQYPDFIMPFLQAGHLSAHALTHAIRQDISDEDTAKLITHCTNMLEESMSNLNQSGSQVEQLIEFVSVVVDAKFVNWFVKCGNMGSSLARLAALINRYRRSLFLVQQAKSKSADTKTQKMLHRKTDPTFNGSTFVYQLR